MHTLAADIIIVGSGLAAHRAALEALSHDAEVLMIEKCPQIGGSTVMSGGSFAFAGTDLQRSEGIHDSEVLLRQDLFEVGGGCNDPALINLYVDSQLNEYALMQNIGAKFGPVQLSSGQSVPRSHPSDPKVLLMLLHDKIIQCRNLRLFVNACVTRLIQDNGRVSGVLAEIDGTVTPISARRGVVLASGGFSRGEGMLQRFAPSLKNALRAGGIGNEGDGIRMAWALGADLVDFGFLKGTFGSYIEVIPDQPHTTLLPVYRGAIAVNLNARRFVDESKSYKQLGVACLEQRGSVAYQIFDAAIMGHSVSGVPSFDFKGAHKRGHILEADSIPTLADMLELDGAILEQTVDRYNEGVAKGLDDEFGRAALAHHYGERVAIQTGPFYGYPCTASINSTYAGLRVNTDMAVCNVWEQPISGLRAAGEIVGGFHGQAYMTWSSLVKAMIFGKVAAESLLEAIE